MVDKRKVGRKLTAKQPCPLKLREYADLGLTMAAYCRDENINRKTLYQSFNCDDDMRSAYEYHRNSMNVLGLKKAEEIVEEDPSKFQYAKWMAEIKYGVGMGMVVNYNHPDVKQAAVSLRDGVEYGDVSSKEAVPLMNALKTESEVVDIANMKEDMELLKSDLSDTKQSMQIETVIDEVLSE